MGMTPNMPFTLVAAGRCRLVAIAGLVAACSTNPDPAVPDDGGDPAAAFLGTWNYLQPDRESGVNMAALHCPAGAESPAYDAVLPQIGNVVFTRFDDGRIQGRTDQGCTWTFVVDGQNAQLDPPEQSCANEAIGQSYTITEWSVSADGASEREALVAVSHQAVDCRFELADGRRTRVDSGDPSDAASFVGTWEYVPPTPDGTNLAIVTCDGDEPRPMPVSGSLSIEMAGDNKVVATSSSGCSSTLVLEGNTAHLVPEGSDCTEGPIPSFWSMTSDGRRMFQILTTRQGACTHVLAGSELRRQ